MSTGWKLRAVLLTLIYSNYAIWVKTKHTFSLLAYSRKVNFEIVIFSGDSTFIHEGKQLNNRDRKCKDQQLTEYFLKKHSEVLKF